MLRRIEDLENAKVRKGKYGPYLCIDRSFVPEDAEEIGEYLHEFKDLLKANTIKACLNTIAPEVSLSWRKSMLFFDIESLGFPYDSPICMISYSYFNGDLNTRVLFARDYSEEPAILDAFLSKTEEISDKPYVVVSYNGQAFDIPRMRNRVKQNGMAASASSLEKLTHNHIDLIKVVRKNKAKLGLTDCSLQTVERILFDHIRSGDISGASIPDVYHQYVYGREKDNLHPGTGYIATYGKKVDETVALQRIAEVIKHNQIDTLSLVALTTYLGSTRNVYPVEWDEVKPDLQEEEEVEALPF